ncbi:hypothetical protein HPG69_001032, partial [Diceros bicornis minor]
RDLMVFAKIWYQIIPIALCAFGEIPERPTLTVDENLLGITTENYPINSTVTLGFSKPALLQLMKNKKHKRKQKIVPQTKDIERHCSILYGGTDLLLKRSSYDIEIKVKEYTEELQKNPRRK